MAIVEGDVESLLQAEQQASVVWLRFFRREIDSDEKSVLLGTITTELEQHGAEVLERFYSVLPRIRNEADEQIKRERRAAQNQD